MSTTLPTHAKQQPMPASLQIVHRASRPPAFDESPCRAAVPPGAAFLARLANGRRFVPAGTGLYREGDEGGDLYVVLEGWMIQYQILSDGRRQILDFALPGSVLGFVSPSDPTLRHSAESLTGATVAVIAGDGLRGLLRSEPEIAAYLISAAAEALNLSFESVTDIGRRTAREAVAHLLLRLYARIHAQGAHGAENSVMIPLTQEHIGDALGLTAVHVCRTLRCLRQEGILCLSNGMLTIADLEALRDIAGAHRASELRTDDAGLSENAPARSVRLAS